MTSRSLGSLFVALFVVAGCDRVPIYTPTPVSPNELRNAFPKVATSDERPTRIVADDGRSYELNGSTEVYLPSEPPVRTEMRYLASECLSSPTTPPPRCELDGRTTHPSLWLETGAKHRLSGGAGLVLGVGVVAGVVGGIAGLEAYCFANCGDTAKTAIVVGDATLLVVAGLVLVTVVVVIANHHGSPHGAFFTGG